MLFETTRSGVQTQLTVGENEAALTIDVPRDGVAELLPGDGHFRMRMLMRSGGGAILSEHNLDE